ncbi:putative POU domain, class 6, transcription factor 1 isoform X2 [Apostichopus japonicus]|uniref:POU domain protein n=1 Tax=Stichopus japonicus TaxID=307972 RepID=A0A2G8KZ02_STIJA|nr:putative POU domain, class 6, transcription factor 1 isoform X2 [Apostichopus japonicus]
MEVKSILAPQTATTVQAVSSVNANQALLGTQILGTTLQRPQSATDQLLLAMQSAAASNSAAKVGISGAGVLGGGLVTTKQTVLASSKFKLSPLTELFFSLYEPTSLSVATATTKTSLPQAQPLIVAAPALPTVQTQTLIPNQLASPQSFLTLQQAAGSHTGQSQMITLPITNAAGQQQLLTIPVTLAQGQGGVQFLIPTSGGLFAANISSLTPVSPQVSAPGSSVSTSPTHASTNQLTSTVSSPTKHHATTTPTTPASTPLPPVSVLTGQAGLGQLPVPHMLLNSAGQCVVISTGTTTAKTATTTDASLSSLGGLPHLTTTPGNTLPTVSTLAAAQLGIQGQITPGSLVSQQQQTSTSTTSSQLLTQGLLNHKTSVVTSTTSSPSPVAQVFANGTQALSLAGLATQTVLTKGDSIVFVLNSPYATHVITQLSMPTKPQYSSTAGAAQLVTNQVINGQSLVGSHIVTTTLSNSQASSPSITSPTSADSPGGHGTAVNTINNEVEVDGVNLEEIKEFAKVFKIRRLSLGLTQTQVGQALSAREGPTYSQSAICRFEKLDITPRSAQKIKPVLERWMAEAEARHKNGFNQLSDFIGTEPSKKRKRRTSFTPQALEYLNRMFDKNTHPTGSEMTSMSQELNYDREVIRVWFCNKRQALKNTIKKLKAAEAEAQANSVEHNKQVIEV